MAADCELHQPETGKGILSYLSWTHKIDSSQARPQQSRSRSGRRKTREAPFASTGIANLIAPSSTSYLQCKCRQWRNLRTLSLPEYFTECPRTVLANSRGYAFEVSCPGHGSSDPSFHHRAQAVESDRSEGSKRRQANLPFTVVCWYFFLVRRLRAFDLKQGSDLGAGAAAYLDGGGMERRRGRRQVDRLEPSSSPNFETLLPKELPSDISVPAPPNTPSPTALGLIRSPISLSRARFRKLALLFHQRIYFACHGRIGISQSIEAEQINDPWHLFWEILKGIEDDFRKRMKVKTQGAIEHTRQKDETFNVQLQSKMPKGVVQSIASDPDIHKRCCDDGIASAHGSCSLAMLAVSLK
ncbi:hypothetical protein ARMSODRAFT_969119 [Armillaria solidipes]|uniref:Uncharacterized protein n=1 Tax=Armillaria solidipes TaxID=1076256 RepID=A0A2H3BZY9_9AGAR|nr:hypothetical protein ARMSODRAFT_969119 [Armillaria solidipes]